MARQPISNDAIETLRQACDDLIERAKRWHENDCIDPGEPLTFDLSLNLGFFGGRGFGTQTEGPLPAPDRTCVKLGCGVRRSEAFPGSGKHLCNAPPTVDHDWDTKPVE